MKSRRVATFAEEGKWTSGADATMLVGDWQAWVDGEGHWKVRGPDPDNAAHYADGDIELTEAEYIEAGNSEARRKIRARRAKEAARAYIKMMTQPSKRHHAMKKSPAQLQREIDEHLAADFPRRRLARAVGHRRGATLVGLPREIEQYRIAFPRGPREPRASVTRLGFVPSAAKKIGKTRSHATIAEFDPSQLRVGQRFDHFGHTYEILKIGRDKNRTVQMARPHMDRFGKAGFIDHRSFPARDFDRQHLRPLTG